MIKSLFFRFLLIIVLPILVLQFVGLYIFYERHWESVSKRLEINLVGEVKTIYRELNIQGLDSAQEIAHLLSFKLDEIYIKDVKLALDALTLSNAYLKDLSAQLTYNIKKPVIAEYTSDGEIKIHIFDTKNKIYALTFSHKKIHSPTVVIFLLWMVGSAFLLILISVIFMKNQVRAILNLTDAAEKLGKGQKLYKFKPTGAKEIRGAGIAFLKMQARIERQIYYRTQLLAHISHDLRTPLTRIRLATEFMGNAEFVNDLNSEIKLMENIIDEYLNFAKEEGNESLVTFNIVKRLNVLLKAFNNPNIFFNTKLTTLFVTFKPHAFERVINNLIDNGLKYYNSKVVLTLELLNDHWYLYVDDDGRGIPKNHYKKVFQPFYKIDKSSKGFGLGLAAVKSIIYNRGGKIKLAKSELGGLRVIVKIPL